MSRRLQIPITKSDEDLLKSAAKKQGLPTAEWARRQLIEKAKAERLGSGPQTPEEALKVLFSLEAPVSNLKKMIVESIKGKLD